MAYTVIAETKRYEVRRHKPIGIELLRHDMGPGVTIFFQGDDEVTFENEIEACADDDAIDRVCGAYDGLFEVFRENMEMA